MKLWPFGSRAAVLATPILIVLLFLSIAAARGIVGWPGAQLGVS